MCCALHCFVIYCFTTVLDFATLRSGLVGSTFASSFVLALFVEMR